MKRSVFVYPVLIAALSASCGTSPGLPGARPDLQANGPHASGPVSDHPIQRMAPGPAGSMSSSGTAAAPGTSSPASRADVLSAGTAAMHEGLYPRGEALATELRPHGGPVGADAAQRMNAATIVPGRRWGANDQVD